MLARLTWLLLAIVVVAPPAQAQREKSPTLARVIGVVPGLGHVYAGEPVRGLGWLAATVGVAAVGGSISDSQCQKEDEPYTDEYCSSKTIDVITAVATAGVWVWSIVDAGRTAERTNLRRRRFPFSPEQPRLFVARGAGGDDALRVGLALATH